jgi:hypothetical protein
VKTIGEYRTLSLCKKVITATPAEEKELGEGNEGVHAPFRGLVIVNEDLAHEASRVREVICHEVVHDWLDASGTTKLLQDVTRLSGEEYDRFEEQLALKLGPCISSSVSSLAFLVGSPEGPGSSILSVLAEIKAERAQREDR